MFYYDGTNSTMNWVEGGVKQTRAITKPTTDFWNVAHTITLNLAMGGNLGGELDPGVTQADYLVDYVKYYKVKVGKKYYGTLYKS